MTINILLIYLLIVDSTNQSSAEAQINTHKL